ncbi:MAG TPA: hypothetical protein PLP57_09965 [Candidatus Saccharicenans sp.]|nr:hypothetical protein [Candidatus Saccharicenans sp.]HRD02946.1 hypothetical protein [Candidatus Saccharicenans sp.]
MSKLIDSYLLEMEIGQPQTDGEVTVFPLKSKKNPGPEYITLTEALRSGQLTVIEISESGSVPELKAANQGEKAVLMLDGEELVGARQNRVLNTTIWVAPGASLLIPVSCVERNRWAGLHRPMEKSDNLMAHSMRLKKVQSVNKNLEKRAGFRSDQHEVWLEVERASCLLNVNSPTAALKDIYEGQKTELEKYLKAFHLIPGQNGLLVFFAGEPMGCDFLSREKAFGHLFQKLLKSYLLEVIIAEQNKKNTRQKGKGEDHQLKKPAIRTTTTPGIKKARNFLSKAAQSDEKRYKAIGSGMSCRYHHKDLAGASLEIDNSIPHFVFLAAEKGSLPGNYRGRESFLFREGDNLE